MASTILSNTILTSTSSFVNEVLATAGRLEKEDLSAKLGKLSKRTDEVKVKVYTALEEQYCDFNPNLNTGTKLSTQVKEVHDDMQEMYNKVEKEIKTQLNVSTTEFSDLSSQLAESNAILAVLERLVRIQDHLQKVDASMKEHQYTVAVQSLCSVGELLDETVLRHENDIQILCALQRDYQTRQGELCHMIGDAWNECVQWTIPKDSAEASGPIQVQLHITSEGKMKPLFQNIVQALYDLGKLTPYLQLLGKRSIQHIIRPLLLHPDCSLKLDSHSMLVEYSTMKPGAVLPQTAVAVGNLNNLFKELHRHLSVEVSCQGDSVKSLMQLLGDCVATQVLETIVEECLKHSVPSTNQQLYTYNENVVSPTELLHMSLINMHFIGNHNTTLMDFVQNVNVMFANKKTQEILQKARGLLTSDIHNMVQISAEMPLRTDLPPLGLEGGAAKKAKTAEKAATSCITPLSANTFKLPTCYISVSVQQLMQLAYGTLHEATNSDPQCAVQLFYAVRQIFELFCYMVPTYHREALTTLPQLSALHHNNCLYVAHHLLTLGHQFRPRLPEPLSGGLATFVDLLPKIRRMGPECLLRQMTRQRDQLSDCLAAAHGFLNVAEDDNYSKAERAIKQTLHQLHHLYKVWREVLPLSVYCKTIGTLLNSAVADIMTSICSLEDISADDATQLSALLSLLTARALGLYQMDGEGDTPSFLLHKHVTKWGKLGELQIILNAGLHDISDRWADGKGPIAAVFSPDELKQLIRALFQNTDRRAAVLAKI